jgi:hypothetical protein
VRNARVTVAALAAILLAGSTTVAASQDKIEVKNLDLVVKDNPLGDAPAMIVDSIRAGGAELGVW